MTRSSFGLCLSALSLVIFSVSPVPAQTPDATPATLSSPDNSQKSSQPHQDAAGLALLGVVVGGAALMGSGSHGSDNSPSISANSDFVPSATAPQMIYTQAAPSAAASVAPAVISTLVPAIVRPTPALPPMAGVDPVPVPVSIFAPTSPVVIVTYPIVNPAPPIAAPVVFSPQPAAPQPLSAAPVSGPTPVATVPEPGTTAALGLGSLLLGGLLVRARRNVTC